MNCQEVEESLGAYVLEAMSEDERRAIDAHLANCSKCQRLVQQLQSIVEAFPLSVPAVDPSPQVKERIFARINELEAERHVPMPLAQARQRRVTTRWRVPLLAATVLSLVVIVGALLIWNITLRQQLTGVTPHVSNPVTYQLHGTQSYQAVSGQLTYYADQHLTVIVLHNVTALAAQQVYQGWLVKNQSPVSIGVFNLQKDVATLDFQGSLDSYQTVAVSLEAGPLASAAPRGPVIASGSLSTQ